MYELRLYDRTVWYGSVCERGGHLINLTEINDKFFQEKLKREDHP